MTHRDLPHEIDEQIETIAEIKNKSPKNTGNS